MFMTERALASFQSTYGWKVGVDGSVAIVTLGAGGAIDTENLTSPVLGFILDPAGLMYNLTLGRLEDQPHHALSSAPLQAGDGRSVRRLAFSLVGVPLAANRGVVVAGILASVRGASIFVRRGPLFAAAPLEVPMTIGICRAQRSIADHAILGRRSRAGADRHCGQHNAQGDNHASHGEAIPRLGG